MYKDLLNYIVKNLVNYPDDVEISEEENNGKIILKLKVNKEDMGRVIGKQGRIAKAIRTIMGAAASKAEVKVAVEID